MTNSNLLIAALHRPNVATGWRASEWGLAIRQARSANLLGALADKVSSLPEVRVPVQARLHFESVVNVARQRNHAVLRESSGISEVLLQAGITCVLLKGAAYLAAGLPLGESRHFGDIDIMVPFEQLAEAEAALMAAGWLTTNHDAYDQMYYRRWMHEIPPLRHIRRGTTLDLHHAISPRTAKYRAPMKPIFSAAVPAARLNGTSVLSPADMLLHAAVHLFSEGEAEHALRNLFDIHELHAAFGKDSAFDEMLAIRAETLGLGYPLFLAFHFMEQVFDRKLPPSLLAHLSKSLPGKVSLSLLERIYLPVFQGGHPSVQMRFTQSTKFLLYLRGHLLRMPLHLLAAHLTMKTWKQIRQPADQTGRVSPPVL